MTPNTDKFKKKDNKGKTPTYSASLHCHLQEAQSCGRTRRFNLEGYDDRQVLQLQINAAYSVMRQNEKSEDAWTSHDPFLFSTVSEPTGQLQISMLSATPLGEDMEEEVEEIDKFDVRRKNNKLTADRGPAELAHIMLTTRHSPTGVNTNSIT
jgi:hypothetical protein